MRLNLYNKRFSVYKRVLKYALIFCSGNDFSELNLEIKRDFITAFRESQFLFDKDDDPSQELINNLDLFDKAISEGYKPSVYTFIAVIQQQCAYIKDKTDTKINLQLGIENLLIRLEKTLQRYLYFPLAGPDTISFYIHKRKAWIKEKILKQKFLRKKNLEQFPAE